MKHFKYLFLFIGLALFASCSESDVEGGVIADKNQAKFSGVVKELQTRVTGTSWDENDEVGIYALIGGQEVVYDNMANVQYKTTSGDGVFAPVSSAIRFPDDGSNLDFVAYYPYNSNLTDFEYTVERGTDLLHSVNAKGQNKETPEVSLEFKHALSKLVLNVGLGNNLTSLEGLAVTINNVSTTGKVNLANGDVTADAAESFTPTVVFAEDNKKATITELVMPTQDLKNAEIVFTLGDNTYKWSPDVETVLASNMQYGYKLNLNVEAGELVALIVGSATIGEWETGHEDAGFTDLDPEVDEDANKITIAELRAAYVEGETYVENHFIEGEVILNAEYGNVNALAVYVADETAGVSFFFNSGDDVVTDAPLGAKVKINLQGATWDEFNGLIQLKSLSTSTVVEILETTATTPLEPRVVTIQELLDGKYQSELVQVNAVQFKDVPTTFGANPNLIDSNNKEINVRSAGNATFKDESVPEGNGPFIGVVGMYNSAQLHVRETADLAGMTGPRIEPSFITVDPVTLTFEKAGGTETVSVTANVAWTASSDADWLTIDPASGTNDGTITVTSTENGVDARNATITVTDGAITKTVAVSQKGEEVVGDFAETLFFSEYIEGGGYNKFLEIYNGTGVTVDLSNYKVETYMNGDATTDKVLELSGKLEHGEVFVIYNSQATIDLKTTNAVVDNNIANFNGDDAVALMTISGEYLDIIGHIGERENWTVDDNSTKDNTLVRKPHIKKGVTVSSAGFPELGTEWIGYPKDTGDYIGSHTTDY